MLHGIYRKRLASGILDNRGSIDWLLSLLISRVCGTKTHRYHFASVVLLRWAASKGVIPVKKARRASRERTRSMWKPFTNFQDAAEVVEASNAQG